MSLLLSAFEFCGLSVSCSIEHTRRRFAARSPRANGLMQESYTAKYDNLSCKICTGYTISIYRSTGVSSTSFSPSFGSIDLFTDTAAILNLLALRSIMGCPGGMSTILYTRSVFTRAFRANFSISFPKKKIVMRKKDSCAVLGCNNDLLFPEKYTLKFPFCPKSPRKF